MKARGDGLGFALGSVEFELSKLQMSGSQNATAKVDGKPLHRCLVWPVICHADRSSKVLLYVLII